MTDSQIQTIRRGDALVERSTGVRFSVTTDARLERSGQSVHEVYAASAGGQVVRLTHRNAAAFVLEVGA